MLFRSGREYNIPPTAAPLLAQVIAAIQQDVEARVREIEKENARLQKETEAKLREKSRTEAIAARKASSTNVRSRDTNRAPTEPLGTMEDTMRAVLKESRERAH